MYIKMQFEETLVVVPQCWGGLLIMIQEGTAPEILDSLPENTNANKPVNVTRVDNGEPTDEWEPKDPHHYVEKKYDYFYDCQDMSKELIENALKMFLAEYYRDGTPESKVADEGYPDVHPAIELLKVCFKESALRMTPTLPRAIHNMMFAHPAENIDQQNETSQHSSYRA